MSLSFGIRPATSSSSSSNATSVTALVRTKITSLGYLSTDSTLQILVQEIECGDPECVPLEVLVALLGQDARWTAKILKPLAETTSADVDALEFPASWPAWVALHREFSLKKKHPALYDQIEALSSAIHAAALGDGERAAAAALLTNLATSLGSRPAPLSPPPTMAVPMKSRTTSSNGGSPFPNSSAISSERVVPPPPGNPPPPGPTYAPLPVVTTSVGPPPRRHDKGVRPRGCPCCDPDNIDNLLDGLSVPP